MATTFNDDTEKALEELRVQLTELNQQSKLLVPLLRDIGELLRLIRDKLLAGLVTQNLNREQHSKGKKSGQRRKRVFFGRLRRVLAKNVDSIPVAGKWVKRIGQIRKNTRYVLGIKNTAQAARAASAGANAARAASAGANAARAASAGANAARAASAGAGVAAAGTATASAVSIIAGIVAGLTALGAVVVAVGATFYSLNKALGQATHAALESYRKYAEVSGSMASVIAQRDVKQLQRDIQFGEQTAGSAKRLADAESKRKDQEQRIELVFTNIKNEVLAWFNEKFEAILKPIGDAVEWIAKKFFYDPKPPPGGISMGWYMGAAHSAYDRIRATGASLLDITRRHARTASTSSPSGGLPPGRSPI